MIGSITRSYSVFYVQSVNYGFCFENPSSTLTISDSVLIPILQEKHKDIDPGRHGSLIKSRGS